MAKATLRAVLRRPLPEVWDLVTNLDRWEWRSDLEKLRRLDERTFAEHARGGFVTRFTITELRPGERYAFELENENLCGCWSGTFRETAAGTELVFTEDVTAKKLWMRPLTGWYLKRQQARYLRDLRRALGEDG